MSHLFQYLSVLLLIIAFLVAVFYAAVLRGIDWAFWLLLLGGLVALFYLYALVKKHRRHR